MKWNKAYYAKKDQEENKISVGQHPLRKTRGEGERADSKSSTGQLIRKSRGKVSSKRAGLKGTGSGQKVKPKSKTGRLSNATRVTSSSRYKSGIGYR